MVDLISFCGLGNMSSARMLHTSTVLVTNNVMVCGGQLGNGFRLQGCEVLNVCVGFGPITSPLFGCVNRNIQLSVAEQPLLNGVGAWSSVPAGEFDNVLSATSKFSYPSASLVSLYWKASFCSSTANVTILAPPTAQFPANPITISAGSGCPPYPLAVNPLGDTTSGTWSVSDGVITPASGSLTPVFSWNSSQVGTTFNISFTPNSVCTAPAVLMVSLVNVSCVNTCGGFSAVVPTFGCINLLIPVVGTFDRRSGIGIWSSVNSSVTFTSLSDPNSGFSCTANGTVNIVWSSSVCRVERTVTIISPPTAVIPALPQQLCGSSGSANVGARLFGDAIAGKWTVTPASSGFFDNDVPAFTLFTWNVSGSLTLRFSPSSVCNSPATLVLQIEASCPQVLSKEATIGIAVGATIGGILLIGVGILLAIWVYRVWNRRLVQFRKNDVPLSSNERYKF